MSNKAEKFVKAAYEASPWRAHDNKMIDVTNAIYRKFGRGKKTPPEYQRAMDVIDALEPVTFKP